MELDLRKKAQRFETLLYYIFVDMIGTTDHPEEEYENEEQQLNDLVDQVIRKVDGKSEGWMFSSIEETSQGTVLRIVYRFSDRELFGDVLTAVFEFKAKLAVPMIIATGSGIK